MKVFPRELDDVRWADAREIAFASASALPEQLIALDQAFGRVAAKPLPSLCDLPTFSTSAMDGYAVAGDGPWQLVGEVKAGAPMTLGLNPGEAVVIATGAVIPEGTFGVLRWERATLSGDTLTGTVTRDLDKRPAGLEAKVGDVLVSPGARLSPSQLGLLAAAGYDHVSVRQKPNVSLILFGDELKISGIPNKGRVRDSLGPQLPHWLEILGANVISVEYISDDFDKVKTALANATNNSDLILTTGGTADGPRDYLRAALSRLGGSIVVDRVKVRPGHPMILGSVPSVDDQSIPVIGLPGNPQSAIVALMTLVSPVLNAMLGQKLTPLNRVRLASELIAPVGFNRLAIGNLLENRFYESSYLGSAMLRGVANSSGFAVLPSGVSVEGSEVEWLPLPWIST